jgi:RNA polymerase sigma-70 factor (ECF subfamily)
MESAVLRRGPLPSRAVTAAAHRGDEAPVAIAGEWLRRAQSGDLSAFDRLMQLHEHTVFQIAVRLLRRPEDAQDAVQETFLRLFRFLDRVDPARPLAPWLYRLTVNACRDFGRQRARGETLALDELPEPVAEGADADPAAALTAAERSRQLGDLLSQLADKERAALVLRDIEGLTTEEVAEALGSTPGTVRSQICRARLKLRELRAGQAEEASP